MITSPSQCKWRSNSIILKWTFHQKGGSGIGIDYHFRHLLSSDIVKCTARPLGTGHLRASTLPSRSEMIGGVCLRCLMWSYFGFPSPNWALRYMGRGLRSKYKDSCMTCCGAQARGIQVQGPKPCIKGPIPIQHASNINWNCTFLDPLTQVV